MKTTRRVKGENMRTDQSIEDYLETIYLLSQSKGDVHRAEVARELNVSQPAVTKAVKKLQDLGYVRTEGMHIFLTDSGKRRATAIYARHVDIRSFLIKLGVSEAVAEDDACRLEHVISNETYEALKIFLNSL